MNKYIWIIVSLMSLSACGGGSDDASGDGSNSNAPSAEFANELAGRYEEL